MSDHSYAIDLHLSNCALRGLSEATQIKYREVLYELADFLEGAGVQPHEFELNHARLFLERYLRSRPPRRGQRMPRGPVSASTLALYVSVVRGYVEFLAEEDVIEVDWSPRLKRPKRPRPENIEVVTTSSSDVARMLEACVIPSRREEWDELLCIGTLSYLGWRRKAAAQARREDLDLEAGLMRALEKGGDVHWKPIPHALLELYLAAEDAGVWLDPRDFVIPNRRPTRVPGVRSNKVIYAIVKRVAAKARVSAHPHSLRAAFAVQFDEQHPELQHTLQLLMGHSRPETTQIYLRRKNKAKAMERVRDLSFALRPNALMPPAGFEPALRSSGALEPLRSKLEQLRSRNAGASPVDRR